MENKEIKLKPKKKTKIRFGKLSKLMENKKYRYLFVFLFMLPFIILITVFAITAYKDVKSIKDMATNTVEVKDENIIKEYNYVLRDNATDVQKEYFAELKEAIETEGTDRATIAGLVAKNFVADYYTWTNKLGQYDVSGMYYVFDEQKDVIYTQSRDEFYKYLSSYINEYGSENLLEVESVTVTKAQRTPYDYYLTVEVHSYDEEEGHIYTDVENEYEAYDVACTWTYKENNKFDTSKYATSMNFIVISNNGRFEISEASTNTIDARKTETSTDETAD